jgi:hypothetical protein
MNFIPTLGWIVDEWFFDPNVHGTHDLCLQRDPNIMKEKSTQLQAM